MFRKNEEYKQEKLDSTVKRLPESMKKELENDWSSTFYEYVFCNVDEEKFAVLYDQEGYSRPNKPVNELVCLEIMKSTFDWSDDELRKEYFFDLRVNYALGREEVGQERLAEKTLNNFRRRLLEYEKETGRNLMKEVFKDIRDELMEEFKIDGSLQRMDSTMIEANIKNLTRLDLFVRVLHNFLNDLPDEELETIPNKISKFKDDENLNLAYRLKKEEAEEKLEELAEYTVRIKDRFEDHEKYSELKSFEHVCRVLDEQCYRIPELEDDEEYEKESENKEKRTWEPVKKWGKSDEEKNEEDNNEDETQKENVKMKDPEDISSGSLQNPHDDEATYREKNDERYQGYKANWCETCSPNNDFQIITEVDVDTNNTEDADMLENSVEELSVQTDLEDLLNDASYSGDDVEDECDNNDVTQHFSGIKGPCVDEDERIPLGEVEFDEHTMIECPKGHKPYRQKFFKNNERYWGRFKKKVCDNCELKEECFVDERNEFYSYGFYHRDRIVAKRRQNLKDQEYKKMLQLRAGAESMINEGYHKTGKRTRYTGKIKVKNSNIAKGIGINIKRLTRYQKKTRQKNTLMR